MASRKTVVDTPSPHTPIHIVSWLLAIPLLLVHLPGMAVLAVGYAAARIAGHGPTLSGKDPWRNPAPNPGKEEKRDRSWNRCRTWYTRPVDWVSGPQALVMLGASLLISAGQATVIMAWINIVGAFVWLSARDVTRRDGNGPIQERAVTWAPAQIPRMAIAGGVGLTVGLAGWLLAEWTFTAAAMPLLAAGLAGWIPPMRAANRTAKLDRTNWNLLDGWLHACDKPPVSKPRYLSGTKRHGDCMICRVACPQGSGEWIDGKAAQTLTPHAQASGYGVSFAPRADDATGVDMLLTPKDRPEWGSIGDEAMRVWAARDLADTAVAWHAKAGGIATWKRVSTEESKGRAWLFTVHGVDEAVMARDWLQGAPTDLGVTLGGRIMHDPGGRNNWLLDPDWPNTVTFDDRAALKGAARQVTKAEKASDYLGLLARSAADARLWEAALDKAKLGVPIIDYDHEVTIESNTTPRWALTVTPMALNPRAYGVRDYLGVNLRAAFGDATVADLLPLPRPNGGGWQDRRMRFVREKRGADLTVPPQRLGDIRGTGIAEGMLATVLVSRALAELLKRPCYVAGGLQLSRSPRWSLWRMRVDLPTGVVPADLDRASARIRGALGAAFLLPDWTGDSSAELWVGDIPPMSPEDADQWTRPAAQRSLIMKRLDRAWSDAGVKGGDGSAPHCVELKAMDGGMVGAEFALPAGVSGEAAMARVDRFKGAAGYLYVRALDPPAAGRMRLIMGVDEPLPRAQDADWTLMGDRSKPEELPFGVGEKGVAVFAPKVSPHLLITGTTGFGKSSAGQVIMTSAVMKGWDLIVCDPTKGGNDFLSLERHALAFARDLDHTQAALDWTVKEMHRRMDLYGEHHLSNVRDLPADIRPKPLLVVIDEFNSLIGSPERSMANPGGDPTIANANLRAQARNRSRGRVGQDVCDLAAQARSAGIVLLLMAQALSGGELDLLPDPGTLKRNLARLFLGNGNAAGNVSQSNIRPANQLIRSWGDMPKGRGVYEETGRRVVGVQCWWSGGPEAMAAHVADLPPVEPLDLSDLLPARPKTIGVIDEPAEPAPVEVVKQDVDGFFD